MDIFIKKYLLKRIYSNRIWFFTKKLIVTCFNPIACANRQCKNGSYCKIHEPTGQSYCEPSCDINNGGCYAEEICSLRNVTCAKEPCPPVVECSKLYVCLINI